MQRSRQDLGDGRSGLLRTTPAARSMALREPAAIARGRWSPEECRLLLAMRREGIQRKVIARVLMRSPKSVKTRLELIR